jgi:hypothetical protein
MKTSLKACALILATIYTVSLLAERNKWPTIQSLEKKRVITDLGKEGADTPVVEFIKDAGGVPAYKLACHTGDYENESEINFSGDFQCALFAVKGTILTSGDLLAADTKDELSTDWWNRGRVRSAQLRGECLRYPEYSTDRRFKLRGMLVILRFTNIQWSAGKDEQGNPRLAGFTLDIKVVPNKSAQGSRSELVPGQKPPASCYP